MDFKMAAMLSLTFRAVMAGATHAIEVAADRCPGHV